MTQRASSFMLSDEQKNTLQMEIKVQNQWTFSHMNKTHIYHQRTWRNKQLDCEANRIIIVWGKVFRAFSKMLSMYVRCAYLWGESRRKLNAAFYWKIKQFRSHTIFVLKSAKQTVKKVFRCVCVCFSSSTTHQTPNAPDNGVYYPRMQ